MNDAESKFVRLYAREGKTYPEIEKELGCDRARVRELHARTAIQCRRVLDVKAMCSRKNIKDFEKFFSAYNELKSECLLRNNAGANRPALRTGKSIDQTPHNARQAAGARAFGAKRKL